MNIVSCIRHENRARLGHIALIESSRQVTTYGELFARIRVIAAQLAAAGLRRHDRVAFQCPGGIEYITLSLAVLEAGGVIVPVPYGASADEARDICAKIGVNGFITLQKGEESQPFTFQPHRPSKNPPEEYFQLDPAFIRFSSGTTGDSKGVLLSHQSIIERTDAADEFLKIRETDVIVWVLSMAYHFVVTVLLFLRRGAVIVVCEDNFPDSFLEAVRLHRPTFFYASPFHYDALISAGLEKEAFSRARLIISTAMSASPELSRRFYETCGKELSQAYGIIEAGLPFVNVDPCPGTRASVGKAGQAYEVSVRDPDESGTGQIWIRGKGMFDAYYEPWQARSACCPDGWFRTGDLGRLDEEGYLFIRGRKNNVINFCGMKVFPEEVEEVINRYPGIAGSRVYAQAHELYGQMPCADLLPRGTDTIDIVRLRRFCYQHLATYKVPKEFRVVSSIPKTTSGKISRILL
jgi:long-chain acyl-CoA synthetase